MIKFAIFGGAFFAVCSDYRNSTIIYIYIRYNTIGILGSSTCFFFWFLRKVQKRFTFSSVLLQSVQSWGIEGTSILHTYVPQGIGTHAF
jgi:hypothetical protein